MKKLLLLLILSFFPAQGLSTHNTSGWFQTTPGYSGSWSCTNNCDVPLPDAANQNWSPQIEVPVGPTQGSFGNGHAIRKSMRAMECDTCGDPYDKITRISGAFCSGDSDNQTSVAKRETTPEYWTTYLSGVVNNKSLKEFFNITNNQYNSDCDAWLRKYLQSPFNKSLVFAYDQNIAGITSLWVFSYNGPHRSVAEQVALRACEENVHKIESHTCAVLFINNNIVNKDYLALAKMNNDEYIKAISNYENQASEVRLSQSELSDVFK